MIVNTGVNIDMVIFLCASVVVTEQVTSHEAL